jgi:pre-mRNA-splicing factor 18
MTNLQRLRPTDPSRSVDFDVHGDIGRGVAGGGSNRVALLEAQAHGDMPLTLPSAPHMMAADGSVKIPQKWDSILRQQAKGLGIEDLGAGEEQQQQHYRGGRH